MALPHIALARLTAVAGIVALACAPAAAQERSGSRAGFVLPAGSTAKIVLLRPSIAVGAQSTGGMFEPNADWTDQARENIGHALAIAQSSLGTSLRIAAEPVGADAARLADYRGLFATVAEAVITFQFFPGNRLPTKKRKDSGFDWTLGPGVRDMPGLGDADYILFLHTDDQYGSTGRKVLQVFAAMGGVAVISGVHKGFAGLVERRTGNLVWLNADLQMGGDVRTADGAAKRVAQLLAGFPGMRPAPAQTASR